jgi:hypothetical protein
MQKVWGENLQAVWLWGMYVLYDFVFRQRQKCMTGTVAATHHMHLWQNGLQGVENVGHKLFKDSLF